MEYLMTYGWAILIIAVVLGALFSLGVFSSSSLLGTACIATSGFLCQSPFLSHTTGGLSFILGQSTGVTMGNVLLACAATSSASGLPNLPSTIIVGNGNAIAVGTPLGFSAIMGSGVASNSPIVGNSLISGYQVTVTGLPCFTTTGVELTTTGNAPAVGTGFTGNLWIAYNTTGGSGPVNAYSKFATISVKST
jgi:hypothetical protein